MGLLSKALSKSKRSKTGEKKGLLEKALSASKPPERSDLHEEPPQPPQEESASKRGSIGLLQRARSMKKRRSEEEARQEKGALEAEPAKKPGLIERAERLVQESREEEGREEEPPQLQDIQQSRQAQAVQEEGEGQAVTEQEELKERAAPEQEEPKERIAPEQPEKRGLLAKASLFAKRKEERPEKEEIPEGEARPEDARQEAVSRPGEGISVPVETRAEQRERDYAPSEPGLMGPEGEKKEEEVSAAADTTKTQAASAKIKPQVMPEEQKARPFPELIEYSLYQNEPLALLELFDECISTEGYQTFFTNTLKSFIRLCRGDSGILFTFQKDRYSAECVVSDPSLQKKLGKLSLSQGSKIIQRIKEKHTLLEHRDAADDNALEKAIAFFSPLIPWLLIPLNAGDTLIGCVLVGNQHVEMDRQREHLLFLSSLFAQYLNSFLLEEYLHQDVEELSKEKRHIRETLKLFNYSEAKDIEEGLRFFSSIMGVESAVIVTGWEERGLLKVQAGIGLSEKGLKRYKISKNDRELQSIIKTGQPGVPKDIDKKLSQFLKDDKKQVKTYVVIPILFQKMLLALFIIHKMKGAGKRVSQKVRKELLQASQCFIPYLLFRKLSDVSPYEAFEQALEREIRRAQEASSSLDIVVFLFQNIPDILRVYGFEKYRYLLDKLLRGVKDVVEGKGMVKLVDLGSIVVLVKDLEEEETSGLIDAMEKSFEQAIAREKDKDVLDYQLLTTRYPDEIDDSTDILSIIG